MKNLMIILLSVCCMSAHAQFSDVALGDIIDINGVKGIVYQVDETGCHGTAMSIKCLRGVKDAWCNDKKITKEMPLFADEQDGLANTKAVIEYANSMGTLDKFPVFKWAQELGEGWYIPSLKELEAFVNYWVGNEQTIDWDAEVEEVENVIDDSKPFYKQVNKKMLDAGGVPFLNGVFTSTVNEDGRAYVFWFNRQKNAWSFMKVKVDKLSQYLVGRAFYRF